MGDTQGSSSGVKECSLQWEAVRTMQISSDRVKEVNAQRLLREFENITFTNLNFKFEKFKHSF
jgi:hypothetical protein